MGVLLERREPCWERRGDWGAPFPASRAPSINHPPSSGRAGKCNGAGAQRGGTRQTPPFPPAAAFLSSSGFCKPGSLPLLLLLLLLSCRCCFAVALLPLLPSLLRPSPAWQPGLGSCS